MTNPQRHSSTSAIVAGIDIGTSHSSIGFVNDEGIPTLIPDPAIPAQFRTPSLVAITEQGYVVGAAVNGLLEDMPNASIARFAKLRLGTGQSVLQDGQRRAWSAEAIHALLLAKLRADFAANGQGEFDSVVIAVPANFCDQQRRAVRRSAELIGMSVQSLMDAPVAAVRFLAALTPDPQTVLVYDFGAGSFEATIVRASRRELTVLATEADASIGCRYIDDQLASHLYEQWKTAPSDPVESHSLRQALGVHAAEMHRRLLTSEASLVKLQQMVAGQPIDFVLTKHFFNRSVESMIAQSIQVCEQCLKSIGIEWAAIDQILMVGGGSRMPTIHQRLAQTSGLPIERVICRQPVEAVTYGAALLAADHRDPNSILSFTQSISAFDLGIRIRDPRTNKLAIYKLIKRNSPLPSHSTKIFKTSRIDQERMVIEVVQVKDGAAAISLGNFSFGPLQPRSANHPVEISLDYDREGIVQIAARDPISGQEILHTLTPLPGENPAPTLCDNDQELVAWALLSNT